MRTYGQYCPIARTSELFSERWTPIIVRNLLAGCTTFGELLEGAPGISRALLAQRLALLESQGVLTKDDVGDGRSRFRYALTDKGHGLKAVTDAMGHWGAEWLELEPEHVTAEYVLWATSKLVDVDQVPDPGIVARVHLADRPTQPFWLVLRQPYAEVCTAYLGWPEDVVVRTDSDTLARYHLRTLTYAEAVRSGRLVIEGPRAVVRAFVGCIRPSPYAVPPPR